MLLGRGNNNSRSQHFSGLEGADELMFQRSPTILQSAGCVIASVDGWFFPRSLVIKSKLDPLFISLQGPLSFTPLHFRSAK